jgi:hypothetical protein
MKTWQVTGLIHASVTAEVDADTAEEAAEQADLGASLCHQCTQGIDLGDVYAFQVHDPAEDGEIVLRSDNHPDDDDQAKDDVHVLAEYLKGKARLPKAVREAVERWARSLSPASDDTSACSSLSLRPSRRGT